MSPDASRSSLLPGPAGGPAARLSVFLSILALALVFWGLFQLDLPLTRFMRSVHLPWLERAGDWLARLGSGAVLAGLSLLLLVLGRLRRQAGILAAGWQGLIAHGAAALLTQVLKHTIGRPRPRMTHGGGFEFGPSFDSGLDSFPSGHSAASFAVATVLARHFPRLRWVVFPTAALIACSRIWRGSHFPTDVMTGVMIGVCMGVLAAYPAADWLPALTRALARLAAGLAAAFTLLWTTLESQGGQGLPWLLMAGGLAAILIGLGARWRLVLGRRASSRRAWPTTLVGVGLACLTGAWQAALPAAAAGLACGLGETGRGGDSQADAVELSASHDPTIWTEAVVTAGVLLAAFTIRSLQGILPLLA